MFQKRLMRIVYLVLFIIMLILLYKGFTNDPQQKALQVIIPHLIIFLNYNSMQKSTPLRTICHSPRRTPPCTWWYSTKPSVRTRRTLSSSSCSRPTPGHRAWSRSSLCRTGRRRWVDVFFLVDNLRQFFYWIFLFIFLFIFLNHGF